MTSTRVPSEASQLAILESDATLHDKAVACHKLVYVAGSDSVAPLAALLTDPKLAAYARSGLEAIAEPAASRALLEALSKLNGQLLAGVVNSLGVRREAAAVAPLEALARDTESGVSAEAIASLGLIANAAAATSLTNLLASDSEDLQMVAGHAALMAAERLQSEGDTQIADALLEAVKRTFADGLLHRAAERML